MFAGSPGSISQTECATTYPPVFSPRSKAELKSAVNTYLRMFPEGDCSHGPYGPIGEWDVSRVTDMSYMFSDKVFFNGDISEWDVSRVTDMSRMFFRAKSFNGDLSKWDVSNTKDMQAMFYKAASFQHNLCGVTWVHSKAGKSAMFLGSSGSISPAACTPAPTPATTQKVTSNYVTRLPLPERDLIARTPIATLVSTSAFTSMTATTITCPKCGSFAKSGRVSCCAPGGAWYTNCGGAANKHADHRWFEGVEACKRKSDACDM